MRLKGKVAIVTGSGKGIGRAVALEFAKEGAKVVVNYVRSKSASQKLVKEIEKIGSKAIAVRADVSKKEDAENLVKQAVGKFERVDVLVNNAGHSSKDAWFMKLDEVTDDLWYSILDTDLKGTFLCSRAAARVMQKQGSGKIINVSSIPALVGDQRGIVYAAAKAGVLGLTKVLARILAPKIQVNAMVFGSIRTGWIDWLDKKEISEIVAAIPLKRLGEPEDIVRVAVFLASRDSHFITGQTIVIDGGETMA